MASARDSGSSYEEVKHHKSHHESDRDGKSGRLGTGEDSKDRKRSRSPRSKSGSPHRRRHSRERRRSREKDRRRHHEGSKYAPRRHSPDRSKDEDRRHKHGNHHRRPAGGSRSTSQERHDREHERSKLELRQQMAKNYEEQLEKMRNNQYGPPNMPNKYNNQVPVDPSKLVEQIEKRKFLFKKDKPAETVSSNSLWKKAAFTDDSDGKMTAKFKRLMGMKDGESSSSKELDQDSLKKQDEYFANLEKQYEVARATTHTQRGLGLGFSSRATFPLQPKP